MAMAGPVVRIEDGPGACIQVPETVRRHPSRVYSEPTLLVEMCKVARRAVLRLRPVTPVIEAFVMNSVNAKAEAKQHAGIHLASISRGHF